MLALSALLAACNSPSSTTPASPSQNTQGQTSPLKLQAGTDWIEGLDQIARSYPAFAGYTVDAANQTIDLLIARTYRGKVINDIQGAERGRKLGQIRQAFQDLMQLGIGIPTLSDAQGKDLDMGKFKIKYRDVNVSLDDLNLWRKGLRDALYQGDASELYINMDKNQIFIRLEGEENRSAFQQLLQKHQIPEASVVVSLGKATLADIKTNNDYFTVPVGGVAVTYGPASGGQQGKCTLGLPVTLSGVQGYLTAAHCSTAVGVNNKDVLYQGGRPIGVEHTDPPNGTNDTREADVVFYQSKVEFYRARLVRSNEVIGSTTVETSLNGVPVYLDVTSTSARPAEGQPVALMGATSGYRRATVTNWNTDFAVDRGDYRLVTIGTVKASNNDTNIGAGCPGDSGGPAYQKTSTTTAKFLGIVAGIGDSFVSTSKNLVCGKSVYFSPVASIERLFGAGKIVYTR